MIDRSDTISRICNALINGERETAVSIACREYPFETPALSVRKYKELVSTRIFVRDGFLDRYSGKRLVFPGALRLLSLLMPTEFPAHPNWKMSESHIVFWELFPTIDHILPIARGGKDDETNWVTTSMLRNSAKSNWTLDELGWELLRPGDFNQWDGLMKWFVKFVEKEPIHLEDKYLRRWHTVSLRVLKEF